MVQDHQLMVLDPPQSQPLIHNISYTLFDKTQYYKKNLIQSYWMIYNPYKNQYALSISISFFFQNIS